ncbi:hypothetical protein [Pseudoxanthomonas sp. 10H]|uniref:hypothetical protein n=1 Tax=Pseudoxanthomonas sp. 10H TaxID=3242729 RepID=UPI0035575D60
MISSSSLRCFLLVLLGIAAPTALADERPPAKVKDAAQSATPARAPAPAARDLAAPAPRPTHAVGRLVCTDRSFKISTGTGGGSCLSSVSEGECKDGVNSATVSCKDGCGKTTGKGTCTEE